MARCKGCGADIIWIATLGGKKIPCDPDQVMYWEKAKASGKVVAPNGMVISCEFEGDPNKATGVGYKPHWATCPCAEQFRRKEETK